MSRISQAPGTRSLPGCVCYRAWPVSAAPGTRGPTAPQPEGQPSSQLCKPRTKWLQLHQGLWQGSVTGRFSPLSLHKQVIRDDGNPAEMWFSARAEWCPGTVWTNAPCDGNRAGHPNPTQAVLKALCKEGNISLVLQIDVLTFSFKYLLFPSVCDLSRMAVALPRQWRSSTEPLSASSPRPSALLVPAARLLLILPGCGAGDGSRHKRSVTKGRSFPAVTVPLSSRTPSCLH